MKDRNDGTLILFYLRLERIHLGWSNINNWGCTQC